MRANRFRTRTPLPVDSQFLIERIGEVSRPLVSPDDLDPLLRRIGEARYVLLGEASHGTSEYYVWRQWISQRLIEEQGFSFIAVEGDWPDCYRINGFAKGNPEAGDSALDALRTYTRWPTWMWANREVERLITWLREHNDGRPAEERVGFYGLDVYSLWDSLEAVVEYLEEHDPASAAIARRAYRCFEPYEDVDEYARAAAWFPESCEEQVVALLAEMRRRTPAFPDDGREARFNAEQNALVIQNAEHYYVPTILPERYDAFLYLDETNAVHPIHVPVHREELATYPVGV